MRLSIVIIICFCLFECKSGAIQESDAKKKYQEHLTDVKTFYKKGRVKDEKPIKILEELTKIKCYEHISYDYGNYKVLTKFNIKDWEDWYQINQNNLVLKVGKLSIINPTPLNKNPVKLFENYIQELKTMAESENIDLDENDYLMDKIEKLIGYNKISYNELKHRLPSKYGFGYLENWLKKNKHKLKWNVNTQSLYVEND